MAAIATKKPYGDIGVAATFPYNFQQMFRAGIAYYPSGMEAPMQIMTGNTFQSEYHELKRLEANQGVDNRGQNNRTIDRKLLTGIHNYHVPKPVLGQRRYANPSMGAESYSSTRRDNGVDAPFRTIEVGAMNMMGSGMRGGVLTTKEGYDFYKNKYNNRIGELNAMNALALGNAVPMNQGMVTYDNTKVGSPSKVEFFILLRGLEDAVTEGDLTRFTFENLKELTGKLFNMAPSASEEDLNDVIDAVEIMLVDLEQGLNEIAENTAHNAFTRPDYANTLTIFMEKIKSYTDQMIRNIYMSERDKTTLSKSLVKSLGFDRLLRNRNSEGVVNEVRQQRARVDQSAADNDDDDGQDGNPYYQAPTREDDEQRGAPRQPFAGENGDPERDRFGASFGSYPAFGSSGYFNDAEAYAAPLALSGAEEVSTDQEVKPQALEDAASAAVAYILQPQITESIRSLPDAEIIASLYPMPSNFVDEVTDRLEEQGFTPAQIAYGVSGLRGYESIFSEYVAENQGDINPKRIGAPDVIEHYGGPGYGYEAPAAAASSSSSSSSSRQPAAENPLNFDYPPTRADLRAQLNTIPKLQAFGATIPAGVGGPYKPRSGSYVKSAQAHIIKLIRKIDPTY